MKGLLVGVLLVLAACGRQLPTPECDTNPAFADSALTCDMAVAEAIRALPADHAAIERIQFLYGSVTPWSGRRLITDEEDRSTYGYVVFTYAGSPERQYVPLAWWHDALTVGSPEPY